MKVCLISRHLLKFAGQVIGCFIACAAAADSTVGQSEALPAKTTVVEKGRTLSVGHLPSVAIGGPIGDKASEDSSVAAEMTRDSLRRNLKIRTQKNLLIREVAGEKIRADLYRPDDAMVYPLVIMIHGGAWSIGDKWDLQIHAKELAKAGFVAVAINYRLAPKHPFPAQLEDCQFAFDWATKKASAWNADSQKVGLWGYSAGAHLAALVACKRASTDKNILACAAGGAPCEFSWIPKNNPTLANVMGGTKAEKSEVYLDASPIQHVTKEVCPFFLYHGTFDLLVPSSSSQLFHQRLHQLGVKSDYHIVRGKGHMLTFLDSGSRQRVLRFFNEHLTDAK